MTKLSEHFTLEELTRSDAADWLGDKNEPNPDHLENLKVTANWMEVVRHVVGDRKITITSGYRNPRVNKVVGGVPNSAHAKGYAVDFKVEGLQPEAVMHLLREAKQVVPFDQAIKETSRNIVHISFDPRARGQMLVQPKGPGTPVFQWNG